jgi:hypothetical protein
MAERDVAPGMQVLTTDGEVLGTVDRPADDGFLLRRMNAADGAAETVPSLWIHRIDEHVHLNRSGAEVITGWKSLKFTTSSGAKPVGGAGAPERAAPNRTWLWIVLALLVLAIVAGIALTN